MEEIGHTIYSGFLGFVVYGRYYILWSEEGRGRGGRREKGEKPWRQICLTHSKMVGIKKGRSG